MTSSSRSADSGDCDCANCMPDRATNPTLPTNNNFSFLTIPSWMRIRCRRRGEQAGSEGPSPHKIPLDRWNLMWLYLWRQLVDHFDPRRLRPCLAVDVRNVLLWNHNDL